jgi:hypothetical protein
MQGKYMSNVCLLSCKVAHLKRAYLENEALVDLRVEELIIGWCGCKSSAAGEAEGTRAV